MGCANIKLLILLLIIFLVLLILVQSADEVLLWQQLVDRWRYFSRIVMGFKVGYLLSRSFLHSMLYKLHIGSVDSLKRAVLHGMNQHIYRVFWRLNDAVKYLFE